VECRVRPRSLDQVRDLIGVVTGGGPAPPLATELPQGVPADPGTVAEIKGVVHEWAACANTGDALRLFALYTDDALRALGPLPAGTVTEFATPDPIRQTDRAFVISVSDIEVFPDGRVGAVVVVGNLSNADAVPGKPAYLVFERQGDRWLIDAVIDSLWIDEKLVDLGTVLGTPAP
jgi:hypothetical protein